MLRNSSLSKNPSHFKAHFSFRSTDYTPAVGFTDIFFEKSIKKRVWGLYLKFTLTCRIKYSQFRKGEMILAVKDSEKRLRLGVIVASIREGRFGETVSRWFLEQAREDDRFDAELVDLKSFRLPWDMSQKEDSDLSEFSERIGESDAFVVVTPEYNHGYPAYLKLAIDSLREEWGGKPVGFVSYGGSSGGLRSVEQLRQVFAELRMTTVKDSVSFHWVHSRFQNGRPTEEFRYNAAATKLLNELAWWGAALSKARQGSDSATLIY